MTRVDSGRTHKPSGIVTALITPFNADESIDYSVWRRVIDDQVTAGIHGLFPIGSGGEFFSLSEDERREGMGFVIGVVNRRVPVYAQVGAVTTRESIRLSRIAEQQGADYLVIITPYYLRPTGPELVRHYQEICGSVSLPVLAYNIPSRTGVELTLPVVKEIADSCSNFIGLKDSTGDINRVRDWISLGLTVFIGSDNLIKDGMELGCVGAVSACANVCPQLFLDLYEAWESKDEARIQHLQALASDLRLALRLSAGHPLIKEAMALTGSKVGVPRRPAGILSDEESSNLVSVIKKLRSEKYFQL